MEISYYTEELPKNHFCEVPSKLAVKETKKSEDVSLLFKADLWTGGLNDPQRAITKAHNERAVFMWF